MNENQMWARRAFLQEQYDRFYRLGNENAVKTVLEQIRSLDRSIAEYKLIESIKKEEASKQ